MKRLILSAAFLATIPAANWMVGHLGTVCPPGAPCMVPVWPWPRPRTIRQRLDRCRPGASQHPTAARPAVLDPRLHRARCRAVRTGRTGRPSLWRQRHRSCFSEMTDWAVYSPLRRRNLAAILAAGLAGAIVDASLFVSLAFGGMSLIGGQVIAKYGPAFLPLAFSTGRRISLPRLTDNLSGRGRRLGSCRVQAKGARRSQRRSLSQNSTHSTKRDARMLEALPRWQRAARSGGRLRTRCSAQSSDARPHARKVRSRRP